MNTNGATMAETNLETVRNPTNLFVGGCQNVHMAYREIEDVLIGRLPISNVDTKSEYNILQWG